MYTEHFDSFTPLNVLFFGVAELKYELKATGNSVGNVRGFDPDQNEPPTEAGVSYSQGLREIKTCERETVRSSLLRVPRSLFPFWMKKWRTLKLFLFARQLLYLGRPQDRTALPLRLLKKDPAKLNKILGQAKQPLADTAAVNATRFKLLQTLKATGLPVETGSGGLTKFNRTTQDTDPRTGYSASILEV